MKKNRTSPLKLKTSKKQAHSSRFYKLFDLFQKALKDLGYDVPADQVETLVTRVYLATENRARIYHSTNHIFDIAQGLNPIQVLATIYHDAVYYQVDGGFPNPWKELLSGFQDPKDPARLRVSIPTDLDLFSLLNSFFGFPFNQAFPLSQANECLSALVVHHELGELLKEKDFISIAVCIAMTRPFLKPDHEGKSYPEKIESDLKKWVVANPDSFSTEEIKQTIHWAVQVANRDVQNFSANDPVAFILGSWSLLPEHDRSLREPSRYPVSQFRGLLTRQRKFLLGLDPEVIAKSYDGVPSKSALEKIQQRTRRNLDIFIGYLEARIISLAIIEAYFKLQKRDPLLSLPFGDESDSPGMEVFLPRGSSLRVKMTAAEKTIATALQANVASRFWFDQRGSKVALFVFSGVTREIYSELIAGVACLDGNDMNEISGWLDQVPKQVRTAVKVALVKVDPVSWPTIHS